MRRYKFLQKDDVYNALNRVRDSFLAAKDGNEVEEIINGLLTQDEKLKIGRRVLVAEAVSAGLSFEKIMSTLKVGKNTIASVMKNLELHPDFLSLIHKRTEKVEEEYKKKSYYEEGGSRLIFKKRKYTGFKRKDVKR